MPPTDDLPETRFADHYLPDDGFTERTLQQLPGPRRRWRRWVLGTATLLSLVIATVLSADVVGLVGQLGRAAAASMSVALTVLAIAITVVAVLALLREEA